MLQYLEIIEQRTTEILEQYAATQPDCTPHPPGTSAIGVVMPPANRIVVAPPAYDDMDEDDEEKMMRGRWTRGEHRPQDRRGLEAREKQKAETREGVGASVCSVAATARAVPRVCCSAERGASPTRAARQWTSSGGPSHRRRRDIKVLPGPTYILCLLYRGTSQRPPVPPCRSGRRRSPGRSRRGASRTRAACTRGRGPPRGARR